MLNKTLYLTEIRTSSKIKEKINTWNVTKLLTNSIEEEAWSCDFSRSLYDVQSNRRLWDILNYFFDQACLLRSWYGIKYGPTHFTTLIDASADR